MTGRLFSPEKDMMADESARVVRNDEKSRYEVWLGESLAGFSAFTVDGDQLVFTHTEVDDEFAGKGLGKALAAGALDDVVARGEVIVPVCPFIAAFVRKNEQYNDHVKWPQ
ncbi:putative GNAT family acetyltransferase [Kibdelosporangium banguiense]|uniref:GNAT family acetyltransferase n=1 Tax=Kibdelosporangium banguiense TaxID=1365924 RepID=A0ABS4TZF6_9PSEU|nr:GNAT family N-acetyltransferase [Kibdelosporangium banguiense]MBP2329794.1 putative GNAT family acetyltransferase [Kibdelosporangium banguiense]